MRVIGIDPGLSGAVAIISGDSLRILDMPTMTVERNGKAKRQVSAAELAEILYTMKSDNCHVYCERVSAMANQGVTSVFSFGRSFGMIEGILAAFRLPVTFVPPATWTKAVRAGSGKDASRVRAMELFPANQVDFKLVKHDGRADAALIAYWGKLMHDKERTIMREHIIWLGTQLEHQRKLNQQHIVFCKRLLDPEDLGYAVSNEIRKLAYILLINSNINEGNNETTET